MEVAEVLFMSLSLVLCSPPLEGQGLVSCQVSNYI